MAQTQVYTLDQFIADVRQIFASTNDPRARAEGVALHLGRLLAVPGWLEERLNLPAEGGFGTYCLHQDTEYGHPEAGFTVLSHVTPSAGARRGGGGESGWPHDHGPCFVVYGVYRGDFIQRLYRWTGGDSHNYRPKLEEYRRFPHKEGEAAFFLPGEIHAPLNQTGGSRSIIIRVTSMDLGQVWRHRYNLETGTVEPIKTAA